MNISWVIANGAILDPLVAPGDLKNVGSFWGGWQTWRQFQTDNVICYDLAKAKELITRKFHHTCNLFVPNSIFADLERPTGVQVYEGEFIHDVDQKEEIVAMHLVSGVSDIVLLFGFEFAEQPILQDKLLEHRAQNYRSLTKQVIIANSQTQWVVIDHDKEFRKDLLPLQNLTKDTLKNVIGMSLN